MSQPSPPPRPVPRAWSQQHAEIIRIDDRVESVLIRPPPTARERAQPWLTVLLRAAVELLRDTGAALMGRRSARSLPDPEGAP